jgi:hypothetical protein
MNIEFVELYNKVKLIPCEVNEISLDPRKELLKIMEYNEKNPDEKYIGVKSFPKKFSIHNINETVFVKDDMVYTSFKMSRKYVDIISDIEYYFVNEEGDDC